MQAHRFYLPPEECREKTLRLRDTEAHHALRVLRLRQGDRVTVLNGGGGMFTCEVENCRRNEVQLVVVEEKPVPPPPCRITLLQAVPKGRLIESIIQKATELGAARIVPLLTARVTTHLNVMDSADKAEKWQHVAIEAIKQCGAAWMPKVEPPIDLKNFVARKENFEMPLVASLQPGSRHPREYFRQFEAAKGHKPNSACVWIGPEGDFTPEEVAAIESSGARPITLGPLVLRVETAATYCLSIVNYELQTPPDLRD